MSDGEEDDLGAQLAEMERAAPLTPEPNEEVSSTPEQMSGAGGSEPNAQQQERAPLSPEEIAKRYDGTKEALRQERAAKRELKAQMDKMEKAFEQIQQRISQPQQQRQGPYTNQELLAMGYTPEEILLWERDRRIQQEEQQTRQTAAQRQQQQQMEAAQTRLRESVSEYEADMREEAPDYDHAVNHLMGSFGTMFTNFGFDETQTKAIVDQLAFTLADQALKNGRNPAKAAYDAAIKLGYTKAQAAAMSGHTQAGAQQNGRPGADKLAQMAAGQAASKTLSGGGSGVAGNGPSLKTIASLEGAAFDAAMDKLLRDARR